MHNLHTEKGLAIEPFALYLVALIQKGPIYSIWINSASRIKSSNNNAISLFITGNSWHAISGTVDHKVMQSSVTVTQQPRGIE